MTKFSITILVHIAICVSTSAVFAQSFTTAKFADTDMKLVIPKGYCVIPRDDELGALHYKLQEDGNKGKNKVAILFADCREWAQRKKNPAILLQHHGNYLFQLTQGEERLLPATTTRAELVKIFVDHELKSHGSNGKDIAEIIRQRLANSSVAAAVIQDNLNLGLIDRDERAAFVGMGGTYVYEGRPVRFVGVLAATITRRASVTVNLYGPSGKGNPFSELLAQQKDTVRQLIASN